MIRRPPISTRTDTPFPSTTPFRSLLANATNVQSTPLWQVMNPIPFPNTDPAGPDPRIAATQAFCDALRAKQPPIYAAIEPDALQPDEDPYMFDKIGRASCRERVCQYV